MANAVRLDRIFTLLVVLDPSIDNADLRGGTYEMINVGVGQPSVHAHHQVVDGDRTIFQCIKVFLITGELAIIGFEMAFDSSVVARRCEIPQKL